MHRWYTRQTTVSPARTQVKLKQQMEQEQTRLEHEKTRRAAQLERARKQAELMAIRKKEQAAQDVQVIFLLLGWLRCTC